ncbi:hypothetical protein ACFYXJ_06575 [Streptomyces sp. NPDC002667]|uniref:hypothetical protein n=1 Tax=Streptomyces sp. NPDC002667 TaxID=3364657 RepID=UPI0036CC2C49
MNAPEPGSLLSLRTATIFLLAALVALGAGILTILDRQGLPAAVLVAGGTFGGATWFFHMLID